MLAVTRWTVIDTGVRATRDASDLFRTQLHVQRPSHTHLDLSVAVDRCFCSNCNVGFLLPPWNARYMECHLINATAPFIINSELRELMARNLSDDK